LVIAHPNKDYIMKENISTKSEAISEGSVEASEDILNNNMGSVTYTLNNISSMNYYQYIPNTDNWKLVIKIPVEYWHAPIRHSFISHINVGVVGLLFAAVLGFFIANGISDPIIRLRGVFIKAARGDLTIRSEINTDDEIGDASRSFNIMMDKISNLTYYDSLTHLPNRMLFTASLDMELERAKEQSKNLAVLVLDLDKFEGINNILGHTAGDKLLKGLAEKLLALVDRKHIVSHMGEDRFAILLRDINNRHEVIQLANEIRSVIKQPWVVDEHSFYITACFGISFYPDDGSSSDSLFKNAFSAMQKAKRRGRDNIELYEPTINARLLEQLKLDSSMHHALDNGEFVLYYQPQIDTVSKELVGCEALIRWQHPELGMISPLSFIPVAEANGLIISIGRWVLYTACKQNKLWQDSGLKPIYISVNLSAAQLIQEDFPDMVSAVLAETGLAPEYLELEITESVAVKNPEYITDILHKLRNMGVRIALDDFGTGYSSLNYLKNFAITTLKIDRSFISDINDNPKNAAIVSTILAMGHNLELKVTAEGVESCEQYDILRKKGCDTIQGFYFSKPLAQNEFEEYMEKLGDS
jgi:diguanylate cyclase (GGDEF)-like protein